MAAIRAHGALLQADVGAGIFADGIALVGRITPRGLSAAFAPGIGV